MDLACQVFHSDVEPNNVFAHKQALVVCMLFLWTNQVQIRNCFDFVCLASDSLVAIF